MKAKTVVDIARKQVGYHEKNSRENLDMKAAPNDGDGNYTKYAQDLHDAGYYQADKNGFEWCDVFCDWNFWEACGRNKTAAEALSCQTGLYGAGCEWSAGCYERQGRLDTMPKVGDQAFFGRRDHTGIVSAVNGSMITVIEGNVEDEVQENVHDIRDGWITEFGHPFYEVEEYTLEEFTRDVQGCTGTPVDGIVGPITMANVPYISKDYNSTHEAVLYIQKRLHQLGYVPEEDVDGIAGPRFEASVLAYKQDHMKLTGEVDKATWLSLFRGE